MGHGAQGRRPRLKYGYPGYCGALCALGVTTLQEALFLGMVAHPLAPPDIMGQFNAARSAWAAANDRDKSSKSQPAAGAGPHASPSSSRRSSPPPSPTASPAPAPDQSMDLDHDTRIAIQVQNLTSQVLTLTSERDEAQTNLASAQATIASQQGDLEETRRMATAAEGRCEEAVRQATAAQDECDASRAQREQALQLLQHEQVRARDLEGALKEARSGDWGMTEVRLGAKLEATATAHEGTIKAALFDQSVAIATQLRQPASAQEIKVDARNGALAGKLDAILEQLAEARSER